MRGGAEIGWETRNGGYTWSCTGLLFQLVMFIWYNTKSQPRYVYVETSRSAYVAGMYCYFALIFIKFLGLHVKWNISLYFQIFVTHWGTLKVALRPQVWETRKLAAVKGMKQWNFIEKLQSMIEQRQWMQSRNTTKFWFTSGNVLNHSYHYWIAWAIHCCLDIGTGKRNISLNGQLLSETKIWYNLKHFTSKNFSR